MLGVFLQVNCEKIIIVTSSIHIPQHNHSQTDEADAACGMYFQHPTHSENQVNDCYF